MKVVAETFEEWNEAVRRENGFLKIRAKQERQSNVWKIKDLRNDIKKLQTENKKPLPKSKPTDKKAYAEYIAHIEQLNKSEVSA